MGLQLQFCSIASPLGELFLAATGTGLCRVSWYVSETAFATELEEEWQAPIRRVEQDPASASKRSPEAGEARPFEILAEAARQLSGYFEGERRAFELPLDFSRLPPFQHRVLTALLQVPYGEVVSYGELAALAGYPGAARAVGGAMRGNPLPIVVPCHRVLLSSGKLGGFGGRPDLKRRLLELEGWREARESRQPDLENLFE